MIVGVKRLGFEVLKDVSSGKKQKEPCSQRDIICLEVKTLDMILSKGHPWA